MEIDASGQEFKNLGVAWKDVRVARIDPDLHRIELENRQKVPYDRLLLATALRWISPQSARRCSRKSAPPGISSSNSGTI